jgi:hypothetical protein
MAHDRPLRLTPPQLTALQLLRDGWRCQTDGTSPAPFGKLIWYGFWRDGDCRHVSGTTLASLERRALIAWEPADITLAYDGTVVPGYALRLTP